jgi:hypothetical protein
VLWHNHFETRNLEKRNAAWPKSEAASGTGDYKQPWRAKTLSASANRIWGIRTSQPRGSQRGPVAMNIQNCSQLAKACLTYPTVLGKMLRLMLTSFPGGLGRD